MASTKYTVPLIPVPAGGYEEQYWQNIKEHRLSFQKCSGCGKLRHLPRPMCPYCHGTDYEWQASSGRGTVYSYVIVHNVAHEWALDKVPYNVVLVEMEEGPRVVSCLLDVPNEEVKIGTPVQVQYEEVQEGMVMPFFRKA